MKAMVVVFFMVISWSSFAQEGEVYQQILDHKTIKKYLKKKIKAECQEVPTFRNEKEFSLTIDGKKAPWQKRSAPSPSCYFEISEYDSDKEEQKLHFTLHYPSRDESDKIKSYHEGFTINVKTKDNKTTIKVAKMKNFFRARYNYVYGGKKRRRRANSKEESE